MTEKFSTGAFVFTRTRGLEPRDPTDLQAIVVQHGIDPDFIPTYPGDRVAITRALTQASRGLVNEGFLLRPIRRTSSEVVYGVVREEKNEATRRLDHDFEATIAWSTEPDPSIVTGDHRVAQRVRDSFNTLRGKIVADDWSSSITSYLESHDAARMRGDGRVYWVPPQRIDEVRKLSAFLATIGINLVMCEIEPETSAIVQDVASTSIDEELDHLAAEADAFDGRQKPSTYSRRLDEYQRLRQRAVLYRDALGVGADRAQEVLDELEQRVGSMLELRKTITVHRDGTVSNPSEEKPAVSSSNTDVESGCDQTDAEIAHLDEPVSGLLEAEPATDAISPREDLENAATPASLAFAGARFELNDETDETLTYVSDDDAAKSSVAALESMGLAGKWQQAGPVRINIQNSGPEGAAVSLRFEVSEGITLEGSATALASWGIELAS